MRATETEAADVEAARRRRRTGRHLSVTGEFCPGCVLEGLYETFGHC